MVPGGVMEGRGGMAACRHPALVKSASGALSSRTPKWMPPKLQLCDPPSLQLSPDPKPSPTNTASRREPTRRMRPRKQMAL